MSEKQRERITKKDKQEFDNSVVEYNYKKVIATFDPDTLKSTRLNKCQAWIYKDVSNSVVYLVSYETMVAWYDFNKNVFYDATYYLFSKHNIDSWNTTTTTRQQVSKFYDYLTKHYVICPVIVTWKK